MSATLSLTEAQTLSALRTVLLAAIGSGTEVIRAEINRVGEPPGGDYVELTPILRSRISTNHDSYTDGFFATPHVPGIAQALQATQVTVQLDIHGPNSADNVQIVSTIFRDPYTCDAFTATGFDIQPLYTSEPRQSPFLNAEQQYEFRWTVDVVLQANPIVTTAQDFAVAATVGIFSTPM